MLVTKYFISALYQSSNVTLKLCLTGKKAVCHYFGKPPFEKESTFGYLLEFTKKHGQLKLDFSRDGFYLRLLRSVKKSDNIFFIFILDFLHVRIVALRPHK